MVAETEGYCLADRNYWKPELTKHLSERGIQMLVPYKKRSLDPAPERSSWLSGWRYRIETVFSQIGFAQKVVFLSSTGQEEKSYQHLTDFLGKASQIVERFQVKRVWARDMWHLASRVMRKVLAHTAAIVINRIEGNSPLRLANLLTH